MKKLLATIISAVLMACILVGCGNCASEEIKPPAYDVALNQIQTAVDNSKLETYVVPTKITINKNYYEVANGEDTFKSLESYQQNNEDCYIYVGITNLSADIYTYSYTFITEYEGAHAIIVAVEQKAFFSSISLNKQYNVIRQGTLEELKEIWKQEYADTVVSKETAVLENVLNNVKTNRNALVEFSAKDNFSAKIDKANSTEIYKMSGYKVTEITTLNTDSTTGKITKEVTSYDWEQSTVDIPTIDSTWELYTGE